MSEETQTQTESDESNDEQTEIDFRLIDLRELFSRSYHEVDREDGIMGDYSVEVIDGCLDKSDKKALKRLGFSPNTTHAYVRDGDHSQNDGDEPIAVLKLYMKDVQGASE